MARVRVEKACLTCDKGFQALPWEVRRGRGKYCSPDCYRKSIIGRKHSDEARARMSKSIKATLAEKAVPELERFESFIRKSGDCWLWTGAKSHNGYGHFTIAHHKYMRAHRYSYEQYKGEKIPEGLTIDHLCRVRACVNPDHLEAVTMRENVLRGTSFAAKNAVKTHCVNGHKFEPGSYYKSGENGRQCKQCTSDRAKSRNRRLKERRAK